MRASAPGPAPTAVPRVVAGQPRSVGAAVEAYLDPALHTAWNENRRRTVTSLLNNWVAAPDIRVVVDGRPVVAAELPLDVSPPRSPSRSWPTWHRLRAHRTYTDVHRELRTMLRWARRQRLLADAHDLVDRIDLVRPQRPDPTGAYPRSSLPTSLSSRWRPRSPCDRLTRRATRRFSLTGRGRISAPWSGCSRLVPRTASNHGRLRRHGRREPPWTPRTPMDAANDHGRASRRVLLREDLVITPPDAHHHVDRMSRRCCVTRRQVGLLGATRRAVVCRTSWWPCSFGPGWRPPLPRPTVRGRWSSGARRLPPCRWDR